MWLYHFKGSMLLYNVAQETVAAVLVKLQTTLIEQSVIVLPQTLLC